MQHVKSLDGVRGVAVLLVVLFHAGLLHPGWIGVQIFFVLSGFLITGILIREKERPFGEFITRFYWRRTLRIFPLYFVFLAMAAIAYQLTGEPSSLAADWPSLITYTTNFGRLREVDVGPAFVHLWSLAVEEQFYLLWPLLIFLLSIAAFKRVVLALLILCPLVRLGLYFVFDGNSHDWIGRNIYSLPISQFDAFAAGAAIYVWRLQSLPNARRWFLIALAATAFFGASVILHDHYFYKNAFKASFGYSMYLLPDWGFVWGYSILNVVSALGVICALQGIKVLESPVLVRIGVVSYGIYVYHVPLFMLLPNWPLIARCAAVYVAAEISFRLMESPITGLKDRVRFPKTTATNQAYGVE